MLYDQPSFPAVLELFLQWISTVEEVNTYYNLVHHPSWWLTMGSLLTFQYFWLSCTEEISYLIVYTV